MVDRLDRGNTSVNCQERTREDLIKTLRLTLKEALEFNRQNAIVRRLRIHRRKNRSMNVVTC